jgi:hypothetical protein
VNRKIKASIIAVVLSAFFLEASASGVADESQLLSSPGVALAQFSSLGDLPGRTFCFRVKTEYSNNTQCSLVTAATVERRMGISNGVLSIKTIDGGKFSVAEMYCGRGCNGKEIKPEWWIPGRKSTSVEFLGVK